jgi:hypothetical protein
LCDPCPSRKFIGLTVFQTTTKSKLILMNAKWTAFILAKCHK